MKAQKTGGYRKAKRAKVKAKLPKRGRMAKLREILLAKRQALFREIRKDLGEHRGTPLRGSAVLDPAEEAGVALEDAINFAAVDRRAELLKQADHALERLKEGTYGICEDCGEEISIGRLKALPFAIRCTGCQEKRETSAQREAFFLEEALPLEEENQVVA